MHWTVLIPVKALPAAKSRLAPRAADAAGHARLVRAIRADTVAAALSTPGVARVVLVVDRPGEPVPAGAQVLLQRRTGLNRALSDAAADAGIRWPDDGVAALLGDLPALRPAELAQALRQAGEHAAGYVPDADGTGTTLLTAAPGVALRPQFGAGSAGRHASAATLIEAGPGLRRDVDTAEDLLAAAALGLGDATRHEVGPAAPVPSSAGNGIVSP